MRHYYNEHNPFAANWIQNLITAGHLPVGDVDERDIQDVHSADLVGYAQCHFFAGIGGWPLALRLAGWPDDKPVWTGSCPCQPFSTAGKGLGDADARHLWPEFRRLIAECAPAVVFGEQVASKAGRGWLAGVRADLEGLAYAVGAADLCAASAGAPHIRQRLFWVADADYAQRWTLDVDRQDGRDGPHAGREETHGESRACGEVRSYQRVANADGWESSDSAVQRGGGHLQRTENTPARDRLADTPDRRCEGASLYLQPGRSQQAVPDARRAGAVGRMGNASGARAGWDCRTVSTAEAERCDERGITRHLDHAALDAGAGNPWADAVLIVCRDGKARRISFEPEVFPVADGVSGRVGRLRAYGNAIVAQVGAEFVRAYVDARR